MKKQLLISLTVVMALITPPQISAKQANKSEECSQDFKKQTEKKPVPHKKECKTKAAQSATKADKEKSDDAKYNAGKDKMHKIEKELSNVERKFKKDKNKEAANAKISELREEMKVAVALLNNSHEHTAMAKRHEHRLHNQLARVKHFINR